MKPLLTAATIAFALGIAAPMASAGDNVSKDRETYESRAHEMIETRQDSMKDVDLNEETQAAWDEVQESWDDMTEAADENWEDAKTSFQENWEAFQKEWTEMTSDQS